MKLKKETSKLNAFAIFWKIFLASTCGGFVNANMVYILRDPQYFGIDKEQQGRVTSNILFFAILVGTIFSFFAGYIYDVCNRKIPMFMAI